MYLDIVSSWGFWATALPLVAWSVIHTLRLRRVVRDYIALRGLAGASGQPPVRTLVFGVNPVLLTLIAVLFLTAGLAMIAVTVIFPPHDYSRTASLDLVHLAISDTGMVEGFIALVCGGSVLTIAVERFRSPWYPVFSRLGRAVYASESRRIALMTEALALDPEAAAR